MLKRLKEMVLDGTKLRVARQRDSAEAQTSSRSGYDDFEDTTDASFDGFSLKRLLKDYAHSDPSSRYQIGEHFVSYILSYFY